jgi:hypothetical protein
VIKWFFISGGVSYDRLFVVECNMRLRIPLKLRRSVASRVALYGHGVDTSHIILQ